MDATRSLNLRLMVHHYCSEEHLFRTITMYADTEREAIYREIVARKSWYWGRYAPGHWEAYMQKRLRVEARMYHEFSERYWQLKDLHPVYFYIYPNFSHQMIMKRLEVRQGLDEPRTKYLLVDLKDLEDTRHISFTVSDSLTSYRKALEKEGIVYKEAMVLNEYAEHAMVFHIDEIEGLSSKYPDDENLYFEIQVWDQDVLQAWKSRNLGAEPADKVHT